MKSEVKVGADARSSSDDEAVNTAYAMAMRLTDMDRDSGENAALILEAIMNERQRCFKLVLECGNYNGRKNLIYRSDALELIQRGVK